MQAGLREVGAFPSADQLHAVLQAAQNMPSTMHCRLLSALPTFPIPCMKLSRCSLHSEGVQRTGQCTMGAYARHCWHASTPAAAEVLQQVSAQAALAAPWLAGTSMWQKPSNEGISS